MLPPYIHLDHNLEEQGAQQDSVTNNQVLNPIHAEHDDEEEGEGSATRAKRTQRKIPLQLKVEIIECWLARRIRSRAAISKKFGVSKTTAHRIITHRHDILQLANEMSNVAL